MKAWKLLKSVVDKDVLFIKDKTFTISAFISKLNSAIYNAFSAKDTTLLGATQREELPLPDHGYWLDMLYLQEDEPSLVEILNNPDLVSTERIKAKPADQRNRRLQHKKTLVSSGITGELLQVGQDWKPCKVVVKIQVEFYVEEEDLTHPPLPKLDRSPLDDIRQSFNELAS